MTRAGFGAAAGVLVAYAVLAALFFGADARPEEFVHSHGASSAWFAPTPRALERGADLRLRDGLEALENRASDRQERLSAYREHLGTAERLLQRARQVQPTRASTAFKLAAVRWDLSPPSGEQEVRRHLELLDQAATLAPTQARLRRDIGELLLNIGRPQEALRHLVAAVRLEPKLAGEAVELLQERRLPADRMLQALPPLPETFVALQAAFFAEGREREFIEAVEPHLERSSASMLAAYGRAHERIGAFERLLLRIEALGPFADPDVEAERLLQRALASFAGRRIEAALADASAAEALSPRNSRYAEQRGRLALAAGSPEDARDAFRVAVNRLAGSRSRPRERARLYAWIGRAEDAADRPHRAYDAYRMALELDPDEPHAGRRLAEMEAAAGRRRAR